MAIARLDDHGVAQKAVIVGFAFSGSLLLSPLGLAGAVVGALGALLAHVAVERAGKRLLAGSRERTGSPDARAAVEDALLGVSTCLRPDRLRDARLMLQAGVLDQALLVVLSDMTTSQPAPEDVRQSLLAAAQALGPTRALTAELERLGLGVPDPS